MIVQPSLEEFSELAKQRRVISVYAKLLADDVTPVSVYQSLCGAREQTFLLESADNGLWSRWSFVGVNAVDYSGYPDCRPEYIAAYEKMANLATRFGVEGQALTIHAPLIDLSKAEIVQRGNTLGVDYGLTVSCYQADDQGRACGACDACRLRSAGFSAAGLPDPTPYQR